MKYFFVTLAVALLTIPTFAYLVMQSLDPSFIARLLKVFDFSDDRLPVLTSTMGDAKPISFDDLNDDVLLEICSHVRTIPVKVEDTGGNSLWRALTRKEPAQLSASRSLSMVNRRLRHLTSPTLFSNIKISGDWSEASQALKVVENCPVMLEYVKSFRFDVYVSSSSDIGTKPPKDLDHRLSTVLLRMPKLEKLFVALPEYHSDGFAASFITHKVQLPTVKTVVVGSFNEFVVLHCPNVEYVSSNSYQFLHSKRGRNYHIRHKEDEFWGEAEASPSLTSRVVQALSQRVFGKEQDAEELDQQQHALLLIKAAARMANVTSFEMYQWWEVRQVKQVYHYLPALRTLAMPGGSYGETVSAYLPTIDQFKALEELILADASSLHVGFDPPGCGNVYMGPGGEEYRRQVEEQGRQATESVAMQVFSTCRGLKTVWIGGYSRADVVRDTVGQVVDLKWTYGRRDAPNGWVH